MTSHPVRNLLARLEHWSPATRVATTFFVLTVMWIFVSDLIIERAAADPGQLTGFQTLKGVVYALIGAVVLYYLIRREFRSRREVARAKQALRGRAEQARAAVSRVERRTTEILENMVDCFFALDEQWRLTYVNRSAERFFGHTRDALLDRDVRTITPTLIGSDTERQYSRVMDERVPVTFQARSTLRPDRWLQVHACPGPRGMFVYFQDISEQKQLEEQLRQTQRLEAVGRLAGGVAHDLNNQMTVVSGCAAILLDELPSEDRRRDEVGQIRRAAERASVLTRQLLAFSRQQVMQPEVMEFAELVRGMEAMLRRVVSEMVELRVEVDPAAGRVEVDPSQIEQVVLELALNAADAMPDGGRLTLEVARADVDEAFTRSIAYPVEPGAYTRLTVSDTGAGMDEETREHVFEPFFTTKEQGNGTGLGLATVYGIIKQSGGYVRVATEEGVGTTFDIFLPRIDGADHHEEPSVAEQPGPGGDETVLVAEDEASVRQLLARVLRRGGYHVIEATNGEEALQAAAAHAGSIDLVLTDVVMPRMGGPELVRELAARDPGIRSMYLSGYAADMVHRDDDARPAYPAPVFIEKPIDPSALLRQVRTALDSPVRA